MRIRSLIAIASLVGLVHGAAPAAARGDGFERGGPLEERLDRLADELGLDDETRARVDALADEARERGRALHAQIRKERDRLRDLLAEPQPDLDAVLAQADAIARLEGDAMKSRLRTSVEVRSLLTPEQRDQLAARTRALRGLHERRRAERIAEVESACSAEIAASCDGASDDDPLELRRCLRAVEAPSEACADVLSDRPLGRRGRGGRHGSPPL